MPRRVPVFQKMLYQLINHYSDHRSSHLSQNQHFRWPTDLQQPFSVVNTRLCALPQWPQRDLVLNQAINTLILRVSLTVMAEVRAISLSLANIQNFIVDFCDFLSLYFRRRNIQKWAQNMDSGISRWERRVQWIYQSRKTSLRKRSCNAMSTKMLFYKGVIRCLAM